ncbi:hypothetical protein AXF42_Ash005236 [Apostasia shenzhenica]|uniref:Uncharacterized protein n=1 Tax=Apostasia shenzhenica TaxID=1088818 RepID=A0A2I0B6E5_9ASPA|nr:hypothetical protein AXF42_Ash005236 [Apostasia shenzhenica]
MAGTEFPIGHFAPFNAHVHPSPNDRRRRSRSRSSGMSPSSSPILEFSSAKGLRTRSFPPGCGRATSGASAPLEDGGTSGNPPPTEASFEATSDPLLLLEQILSVSRAFSIPHLPEGLWSIGALMSKPFNFSDLLGSMERMRSKSTAFRKEKNFGRPNFSDRLKTWSGKSEGNLRHLERLPETLAKALCWG